MWLALFGPFVECRFGNEELILQEVRSFGELATQKEDKFQFLSFFMRFLSSRGRSSNLFVGSAMSTTHFAQVCAQKVWRDISVLSRPCNRPYVHSTIPNMALLDNILDRLLVYLYDLMNLLIFGNAPYVKSHNVAHEIIIQDIRVSQTPISLCLAH